MVTESTWTGPWLPTSVTLNGSGDIRYFDIPHTEALDEEEAMTAYDFWVQVVPQPGGN